MKEFAGQRGLRFWGERLVLRPALWLSAIVAISVWVSTDIATAETRTWTDGSLTDLWNAPGNWTSTSGSGVPQAGDAAQILLSTGSVGEKIGYNYTGLPVTLLSLTISRADTLTGKNFDALVISGNHLAATTETLGQSISRGGVGHGSITQSAGSNLASILNLGQTANDLGEYILSGSGILTADEVHLGISGSGVFSQSGGTHTTGLLSLGDGTGASGTYTLSDTSSLTINGGNEVIGDSGTGVFTQSGGTHALNYSNSQFSQGLYVGKSASSTGTYNLNGGSLQVTNGEELVGSSGTGTFTQTAGSNTISNSIGGGAVLYLGASTGGAGTYNLSGGNLTCTNLFIGFGAGSTGTFNQNGGTATLNGAAVFSMTSGTYNLSGTGLLISDEGQEFIAAPAGQSAVFNQTGGTHTLNGSFFALLSIGRSVGTSGVYNLDGGSLSAKNIFVGGDQNGPGGTGTFKLNTLNTLTLSSGMTVYPGGTLTGAGSTTASVTLNGALSPGDTLGTLSLGSLTVNAGARIFLDDSFFSFDADDLVKVTALNGLTLAGPSTIILEGPFTTPMPLITYSGTVAGSINNLSFFGGSAGLAYSAVNDTANHTITFSTKIISHHTQIGIDGQPAPGAGGGFFSQSLLTYASLNDAGQVGFYSSLASTSDGSNGGIFLGTGPSPIAIARQKQAAPGIGGGTFNIFASTFQGPTINASGQLAFQASLSNTTDGSTNGIFRYDPQAGLTTLARDREPIPGAAGQTLGTFLGSNPSALSAINASGRVAFTANVNNDASGSLSGIFVAGGPFLITIARHQQNAPGAGGGKFLSNFGSEGTIDNPPAINNVGQVAFISQLSNTTDGSTIGLFRGDGATLVAIAREKQALPGTGGGVFGNLLNPFASAAINDAGQVAFVDDNLSGTSPADPATQGLFRGDGNSLVVIARENRAAPGTGGGTFGGSSNSSVFFSLPAINAAGQVGFAAYLTGTNDSSNYGWFRSDGSSLTAIARAKQIAPGTGGAKFANQLVVTPDPVAIAPGGQVAFVAGLEGTPDGLSSNRGLFLGDGQETINVAISGEVLPTNLTDSFLGRATGFALGPNAINSYGQIAYVAAFDFGAFGQYLFTPILHWRNAGSGNWDTAANWTVGLSPASVHDVFIDPANSLTVTGPTNSTTVKSLTIGTGGAAATLQLNGRETVLKTSAFAVDIAGGSKLDVKNSTLVVVGGDPGTFNGSRYTGIAGLIQSGYNGGDWNGSGITTSLGSAKTAIGFARAQDVGLAGGTFRGVPVSAGDVLVTYAEAGDANLDGTVGFADLVALAQHYDEDNGSATWSNGDFNYDGKIDFVDLVALAQNYGAVLPSSPIPGATAAFEHDLAAAFTDVPEPASLLLSGIAVVTLVCRRRRW